MIFKQIKKIEIRRPHISGSLSIFQNSITKKLLTTFECKVYKISSPIRNV